jgi:hypothetical protein
MDCGGVTPCVRDLNATYFTSSTALTIQLCSLFCFNRNYTYFGLENAYKYILF